MASEAKQIRRAAQTFNRLQNKQAKSLKRFGGLRDKLEKSGRKLQTLEAKIAELERSLHELHNQSSLPIAQDAKYLRSARLIINSNAGSFAQKIGTPENLVAMLRLHGNQARVYLKTSSKAVRRWVREAVKKKEELVIVVGGDGTIEDVALSPSWAVTRC